MMEELEKILNSLLDYLVTINSHSHIIFIDTFTLPKIRKNYRVLIDVKGRFVLREIQRAAAKFKLCNVRKRSMGANKIPYIVTHDARTIRYPHPDINVMDTIKLNLETGAIEDVYRFESGKTFSP